MWDPPRPELEPVSPALAGRFSTPVPPGKPLFFHLKWMFTFALNNGKKIDHSVLKKKSPYSCSFTLGRPLSSVSRQCSSNSSFFLRPLLPCRIFVFCLSFSHTPHPREMGSGPGTFLYPLPLWKEQSSFAVCLLTVADSPIPDCTLLLVMIIVANVYCVRHCS